MGLRKATKTNFLDYIYGGCEIKLSVAIDFSKSNGDKDDPRSLHTKDEAENAYIKAIKSAVTIMQYYNASKRIVAYGFGANVVHNHENSNCFSLTGDIFSPQVNGIRGLLEAYQSTLE